MKDPILGRKLSNAKPVIRVFSDNGTYRCISDPTLERSLINAKAVTSVLAKEEI